MYDELVKRVRQVAEEVCEGYDVDPYNAEQRCFVIEEAADAIEELSAIREEQKAQIILMAAEDKPRWIPVTERLPKMNTWVLAYCKYKDHVVDYVDINGLWSYGNVTHWMPLPEPPKEDEHECFSSL